MFQRRVTRSAAEGIARSYADTQGWPWAEPIKVYRELGAWRVITNADKRGGNVSVWVNASSGEVRRGGFAPR